jgi:hypothetical protein
MNEKIKSNIQLGKISTQNVPGIRAASNDSNADLARSTYGSEDFELGAISYPYATDMIKEPVALLRRDIQI